MMAAFDRFKEELLKAYIRPNQPSFEEAYRHACVAVDGKDIAVLSRAKAHAFIREQYRAKRSPAPFFAPTQERLAALRHSRIESAKKILKIVERVQLHGLPGKDDPALDAIAEEFSVLLFGEV